FSDRLKGLAPHLRSPTAAKELSKLMSEAASLGRSYAQANYRQQRKLASDLAPRFNDAAAAIEDRLEEEQRAERVWVEIRLASLSGQLWRRGVAFAAGICACLVMAVLLGLSLRRRLIAPLGTLKDATARIIEHGDLTQTIEVRGRDEIGELAASFTRLVEKLR